MSSSEVYARIPTTNTETYACLMRYTSVKTFHKTGFLLLCITRDIIQVEPTEAPANGEEISQLLSTLLFV